MNKHGSFTVIKYCANLLIDIGNVHDSIILPLGIGMETHGLDYYYRNWYRIKLEYMLLG